MHYYGLDSLRPVPRAEPATIWTKGAEGALAPIVLDTLKTWIHRPLEDNFWNGEALALIRVAQRAIEQRCQIALAPTTWTGTAAEFPTKIIRRPFLAVTQVQYVDPTGQIATLPTDQYVAAPELQLCGQLLSPRDVNWPETATRPDAVRMTVTTEFPTLPDDIVHALLMTVAALDTNRGDGGGGGSRLDSTVWGQTHGSGPNVIPAGAMALLAPYTYRSFMSV